MDHEIHCPPERLWQLYFDEGFNHEMYVEGLEFPSLEIVEQSDDGDTIHRRMKVVPKVDMPKAVAKVVGDKVGYEESGDYVRSKGEFHWRMKLAAFGDKARVEGVMRVVPHGEGRCRRVVDFEVEVKMFGIGKLVEKTASDNTISGWDASAKWINGYLARNPA